jgi:hypothetical protein
MDAKSLRAAMKEKAKRLASSSSEKVDSSDFTPAEPLNADVKTGMRPISRRAFKSGGMVDGAACAPRADRKPRMNGGKIGLANTDQKTANEERDGKKHVGGMKKGGRIAKLGGGGADSGIAAAEEDALQRALNEEKRERQDLPPAVRSKMAPMTSMRPKTRSDYEMDHAVDQSVKYQKNGGKVAKKNGGAAGSNEQPVTSAGPDTGGREALKRGGKAWEGSKMDEAQDAKLAKKRGMSMKEWEASKADDKHDKQKSMKGLKDGGKAMHHKDCMCKACGGSAGMKDGGGLYANIHAKRERMEDGSKEKMRKPGSKGAPSAADFKASERTARKDGGRTGKGKTNINIIIAPQHGGKDAGMSGQPPMPMPPMPMPRPPMPMPAAAPAPMPHPGGMPPGLAAAMAGPAGGPGPVPPMPGGMPPMARKSGGKVYPKMKFGAGSGKGRLEKIEEYGQNAKA